VLSTIINRFESKTSNNSSEKVILLYNDNARLHVAKIFKDMLSAFLLSYYTLRIHQTMLFQIITYFDRCGTVLLSCNTLKHWW